ncbi:MAG: serine/threonine protein kinase [Verrucomicrobia bacterium]|jgi:eukaryotic-like serine/threonine-protein kinase|nr:serine/threonine protein kinase [Verrucomicrobiota bacterium]
MKSPSIEEILEIAVKLPTPQERAAYLRGACAGDDTVREKVESLLDAHDGASGFMPTDPGERVITLPDRPLSEVPGTVIGRYKLLQLIAEGGMGTVFMAEQTEPVRRKVALKIIKLGMDTKNVIARFEAERQALALMDHPNIAKVLDAGSTETGRPFFVMELVNGVPISSFCDKNNLTAKERLDLFLPVCQAIQHAHHKGIIHRDIKPSNILVTLNDGVPHPMVIDFGIAKATNQRLTEKTLFTNYAQMIGTPAYMSPEQAEMSKIDVDTRSDIYSLGVVLYELLTGTTPFPEKDLLSKGYGEMQRIIVEEDPQRPSLRMSTLQGKHQTIIAKNRNSETIALTNQLKGDLDWIIMKALEKDRFRRYDSANSLADDVRNHLNNQPVTAAQPSAVYRLRKFYQREQPLANAALAVAACIILGTAAATFQFVKADQARDAERQARESAERAIEAARSAESTKGIEQDSD